MITALIADRDAHQRRQVGAALRFEGYRVVVAKPGQRLRALILRRRPSVIVMDPWGDPTADPIETIAALRAYTEVPIVVLSSSLRDTDAAAALDAGADDYLAKPYRLDEFLARLRAVLRRSATAVDADESIVTPDFTIDVSDRRCTLNDGSDVRLTPMEWRLIEVLANRPSKLVTHAELLTKVWGPDAIDKSHYIRVCLTGLRHKIEPDPTRPRYFITAPGLGLRFDPNDTSVAEPC